MKKEMAELVRALREADTPAVLAFFAGMPEEDRKTFAPEVRRWLEELKETRRKDAENHTFSEQAVASHALRFVNLFRAAEVAAVACDRGSQAGPTLALLGFEDDFVAAASDRAHFPKQAWCESLIGGQFGWSAPAWRAVRAMVRKGLCRAPDHENYVLGALVGLRESHDPYGDLSRRAEGLPPRPVLSLKERLLREPDWLDSAFWRLFEIEGTSQISLAKCERYGGRGGWSEAIVELSRDGVLSRDRLLDASLGALGRGFLQFRAGWFSRLHEALAPTPAERIARIDTYLSLLGSEIPPTVSFALSALRQIDATQSVSFGKLWPALAPALRSGTMKIAKEALAFAERAAGREPEARQSVCLAATEAFLGGHGDVQARALRLIEQYGLPDDEELREHLDALSAAVRPSLRPRFEAWVHRGETASPRPAVTTPEDAPVLPPAQASRVSPDRAIAPIASLDDLFDRASAILESPLDIDEVERVLAGIARLAGDVSSTFARLAPPLAKRAVARLQRPPGGPTYTPAVEEAIIHVLVSWLGHRNYFPELAAQRPLDNRNEPIGFLMRRLSAVAGQVVERPGLPLLSAPTHRGGWIAPIALVERWLAWQGAGLEPDGHEQVLALLRLAPEDRATALGPARRVRGETGRALRHALGEPGEPGDDSALWLAAFRSAQPYGDLPDFETKHPGLGPGAGHAAEYVCQPPISPIEPGPPGRIDPRLLPVLVNSPRSFPGWEWRSRPLLRWTSTLWPAHRESFFQRAIPTLATAVRWSEAADREAVGFLEPLCDPFTEMRPMACHALVLGLAARDSALRAQAAEGLVAAITEGRLAEDVFAAALAAHFLDDAGARLRWSKVFMEVARISGMHSAFLARALPASLPSTPEVNMRNVGPYLETMNEILSSAKLPLESASARTFLSQIGGSGKIPALARTLLKR